MMTIDDNDDHANIPLQKSSKVLGLFIPINKQAPSPAAVRTKIKNVHQHQRKPVALSAG